ncbi:MAG: hypothetical protein PHD76_01345 [Methylacidiphilales bacterium]|nr:hypothetical protein [Candidatus Methylacidiphilales bacterium]
MTHSTLLSVVRLRKGFCLVEIVLALAVLALALTGILALFPVALGAAADSGSETHAALIAQSLVSEIRAGRGSRRVIYSNIQTSPREPLGSGKNSTIMLDLKKSGDCDRHCLVFDGDGGPAGEIGPEAYNKGDSTGSYIVVVKAAYKPPPQNITQLGINIEWPAGARASCRKRQAFVTWIAPDV